MARKTRARDYFCSLQSAWDCDCSDKAFKNGQSTFFGRVCFVAFCGVVLTVSLLGEFTQKACISAPKAFEVRVSGFFSKNCIFKKVCAVFASHFCVLTHFVNALAILALCG